MKREFAVVGIIVGLAAGFGLGWFIPPLLSTAPRKYIVDKIIARDKLIVGTSADYPPFENFTYPGLEIEGFDVDVSQLIADELGVTLEMTHMSFDALIGACRAGTIDMIAAAMTYDPEDEVSQDRAKQLAPSIPYITVSQVVIVEASSPLSSLTSLDDLIGKEVGVQSGTVLQAELNNITGITVIPFDNAIGLIQELVSGIGIEAAYVDEPIFTAWNRTEDLRIIFSTGSEPFSLWCRQTTPDLLWVINNVINAAYDDNVTMYSLIDKWFG